jgi:small subunit ribosomal protein S6
MYIVHPALEAGRLKDLILSVEKSMHNGGGETCAINVWGKKKLAYPINKEKYGMYILFQFKSNGSSNKEFNLGLEHNANVLAYLTTKIEEEGVLLDLPDLDNQLGLSTIKSEDTNKNDESKDSVTSKTEDSSSDDKNEENE